MTVRGARSALALGLVVVTAVATVIPAADDEHVGALAAVLVSASPGPDDARYDADVLAQYQLLRANGVDDDHIVLLVAGPLRPVVRDEVDGPNLATGAVVDGDAAAFENALASIDAKRLYIFIAGHGNADGIRLGRSMLTPDVLGQLLRDNVPTLVAIEACDSGVFTAVAGHDVTVLTASAADEDSAGTNLDRSTGEWLADEFSYAFAQAARDDGSRSLARIHEDIRAAVRSSDPQLAGDAHGRRLSSFLLP